MVGFGRIWPAKLVFCPAPIASGPPASGTARTVPPALWNLNFPRPDGPCGTHLILQTEHLKTPKNLGVWWPYASFINGGLICPSSSCSTTPLKNRVECGNHNRTIFAIFLQNLPSGKGIGIKKLQPLSLKIDNQQFTTLNSAKNSHKTQKHWPFEEFSQLAGGIRVVADCKVFGGRMQVLFFFILHFSFCPFLLLLEH